MKYKYRNLKRHCVMHGIPPSGTGVFDHPIGGGAIELVEVIDDEKKREQPLMAKKQSKKGDMK